MLRVVVCFVDLRKKRMQEKRSYMHVTLLNHYFTTIIEPLLF